MYLKQLLIYGNQKEIRNIEFKKGLNLIVNTYDNTKSGNNIGKTTILRVIDYCFGSEGTDIYSDKEFSSQNKIYDYLIDGEFYFELIITNKHNNVITIKRSFGNNKILSLNDEKFADLSSFKSALNQLIFGVKSPHPTIRELMPKFIRKDIQRMSNTIYFLHSNAKKELYTLIYCYLFGFQEPNLINEYYDLLIEEKNVRKQLANIKGSIGITKTAIKQNIKLIDNEINNIEKDLKELNLDKYENININEIKKISVEINELNGKKSGIEIKLSINKKALLELEKNKSNIDSESIKTIYDEAKIYIGELNKTFEDVINFHNSMVVNKIDFINKTINKLQNELSDINDNLKKYKKIEKDFLMLNSNNEFFSDIVNIKEILKEKYEERGKQQELLELLEKQEEKKEYLKSNIEKVKSNIEIYSKDFFDFKLFTFNKYFSQFSKEMYGEGYMLSISEDYNDFKIENRESNVGGGKKKGEIAIFDLAYMNFLDELGTDTCNFVLHDSIEDIDPKEIDYIFNLANSINGQYIVSVLSDKINFWGNENIEQNKILSLSQENKFFKF